MSISPLVAVAIGVTSAVLFWTEPNARRLGFSLASAAALVTTIMLATGDADRACVLAALLIFAIVGLSKVKFHHSARVMIVADAPLLFAGTVPFFFVQYRRMMTAVVAGGLVLIVAAGFAIARAAGPSVPVFIRVLAAASAAAMCVAAYRLNGGRSSFRLSVTEPTGFFSTFAASLFDHRSWWRTRHLHPIGLGSTAYPLRPPTAGSSATKPDIIVIQHESVFDPRAFGLTVTPDVAAFLTPPDGRSGTLEVEIFGGGSWQSEFSVMTGIPSGLFGTDAYYLFGRGVGRFKHTLPRSLSELGYATTLISSCRRGFLNYDAFYAGIGMQRRVFVEDLPPPFDVVRFEQTYSDAQFLPAALDMVARSGSGDPQFHYILTNFNHGPHVSTLASDAFAHARACAMQSFGDAEYAEYCTRLAETAAAWASCKARLVAARPHRPTLVVHYGDHQPVMCRRIEQRLGLAASAGRTFRTFFAVEQIGFERRPDIPAELPIAYLGLLVRQAAGLPLDAISATQASMLALRGDQRRDADSRLLRSLVDRNLVDLD